LPKEIGATIATLVLSHVTQVVHIVYTLSTVLQINEGLLYRMILRMEPLLVQDKCRGLFRTELMIIR